MGSRGKDAIRHLIVTAHEAIHAESCGTNLASGDA
jgi:hypothetical protein